MGRGRARLRWPALGVARLALVVIETTDVIFAVDSIPAILAVTTDTFVVFTATAFAVLGMRALYFLLAGARDRFRYLQPGLAVILAGVAAKLLLAGVYELPVWASPAFIGAVLAAVLVLSLRARRRPALDPAAGPGPRPAPDTGPAGPRTPASQTRPLRPDNSKRRPAPAPTPGGPSL